MVEEYKGIRKLTKICNELAETHAGKVANLPQTILGLIHDKHQRYPDIKRFIIDWEVIELKDSFHLNVASTFMDGDVDSEELEHLVRKVIESQPTVPPIL